MVERPSDHKASGSASLRSHPASGERINRSLFRPRLALPVSVPFHDPDLINSFLRLVQILSETQHEIPEATRSRAWSATLVKENRLRINRFTNADLTGPTVYPSHRCDLSERVVIDGG